MRKIETVVYKFDELSESAKENARGWYRKDMPLAWMDENMGSIEAFCNHFGITLEDWRIDGWDYSYAVSLRNENFRGVKLKDFDRHYMPTGYYLDCTLWETFYDTFKATGDAKRAFDEALTEGFKAWREDIHYQSTDEFVDDMLAINGYEFTEEGEFWAAG